MFNISHHEISNKRVLNNLYPYNKIKCRCRSVEPIELKLSIENHIYPGEVIGYILVWYPHPLGQGVLKWGTRVRIAQMLHLLGAKLKINRAKLCTHDSNP